MVVHTEVYGQRLRELLPLLTDDVRLQVAFTLAPHAFNGGALRSMPGLADSAVPWEAAVRSEFDLAIAAGSQGMHRLRAPLVRLPHGIGHMKLSRTLETPPGEPRAVGGLGRNYLMRDGEVIPKALALAHRDDLETLRTTCPQALPVAEVVGDADHDRIVASMPRRARYREALGLRPGQKLVVAASTWGLGSSINRLDALLPRLLAELPPQEYRVAVMMHPNVWSGHGVWQVHAWLETFRRRGLVVVPPEADWRSLLVAADVVLGDAGSSTLYATLTDAVILMARFPEADVDPRSPGAELARTAPVLSPAHPLPDQLAHAAAEYPAAEYARIAARISSEPGRFNQRMRSLLYRLLGLGQPSFPPVTRALPLPAPLEGPRGAHPGPEEVSA